jgi:hypothetical protein
MQRESRLAGGEKISHATRRAAAPAQFMRRLRSKSKRLNKVLKILI